MLLLTANDVRRSLPMAAAIEAMRQAFAALADGRAQVPPRTVLDAPECGGVTLIMPAVVRDGDENSAVVKAVSVFPRNRKQNLPSIHSAVTVLDPETGRILALLEGASLTAIRTGAASGLATDLLARPDSRTAAVFGTGPQARTQLEAVCTVRSIEVVWVCNPTPGKAEAFVREAAGQKPIPKEVRGTTEAKEAVADADVICTATTSSTPVFDDADLKPGVHVNAIGSFKPEAREIPAETVVRSVVVVDVREAALEEAGDLIQPIQQGLISAGHIHAGLGELVAGRATGRTSDEQTTIFKSVGVAAQDAVAARAVLNRATELGLGKEIDW